MSSQKARESEREQRMYGRERMSGVPTRKCESKNGAATSTFSEKDKYPKGRDSNIPLPTSPALHRSEYNRDARAQGVFVYRTEKYADCFSSQHEEGRFQVKFAGCAYCDVCPIAEALVSVQSEEPE